ncbi:uncharacterized protein PRCAT00003454001 [Priceomyces carsonii]|uniref:uncharacterized protein n=1 Tax=Priceomyces carsonii TaxID=28549 RepID=UPI002ED96CD1|nr:unnamed protein product [Priceomyces carsonii]
MVGISTKLIHGADEVSRVPDVIPPINITTTFKYNDDPNKLVKAADLTSYFDGDFWYSRLGHPNSEQVEKAIGKIAGGYVVAYSSGLSAFYAAITYFNPKVLSIGKGYHGCHGIADLHTRNYGLKQISLEDDLLKLGKGDLIHLETPVNPEGTNFDIKYYADRAHEKGAYLLVDSTLAPPPLQNPFDFGADMIMHSATKYFGGHSDLLAGLLITKDASVRESLLLDRLLLGTNIANLESSLLIRSLKTYELRILTQSNNATKIVKYLVDNISDFSKLDAVFHGTLQTDGYIKAQVPGGQSPVFSVKVSTERDARFLPSKLKYFHHATSLGGVESLVEWRALSDTHADPKLLRFSVGVENVEDLIEDIATALRSL